MDIGIIIFSVPLAILFFTMIYRGRTTAKKAIKDKLKDAYKKREYICCGCAKEIKDSEFITLTSNFCPNCGGVIRVNTEKVWCYSDNNGAIKGPFNAADLRKAYVDKEISEKTEIIHIINLSSTSLSGLDSLGSVLKPITPTDALTQSPNVDTTITSLLVSCEECGHKFSKRAKGCPKCGWVLVVICQVCQHKIPGDSISCPECGDPKPFGENNSSNLQIDPQQNNYQHSNIHELPEHEGISSKDGVSGNLGQQSKPKRRRKVTATIVCAVILFIYHFIVSGPLVGWRHGGGAIPNAILWIVIFVIWFSIAKIEDKR